MQICLKLLAGAMTTLLISGLGACTGISSQSDLQHHNYVLVEVNNAPFNGERIPHIEFNEGGAVSGAFCNEYMGHGELANDRFFIRNLVSTKMLCADRNLNELEFVFANMMMNGARLERNGNELILSGNDYTLKFELRDFVN
ncbi:MAG: META domain-containing protein [Desulfovibrionaceae bacterium]|nr:META domain-containing protein [Desulfovibrionaceae bacterium]